MYLPDEEPPQESERYQPGDVAIFDSAAYDWEPYLGGRRYRLRGTTRWFRDADDDIAKMIPYRGAAVLTHADPGKGEIAWILIEDFPSPLASGSQRILFPRNGARIEVNGLHYVTVSGTWYLDPRDLHVPGPSAGRSPGQMIPGDEDGDFFAVESVLVPVTSVPVGGINRSRNPTYGRVPFRVRT